MRASVFIACVFAAGCAAQANVATSAPATRDRFVISDDACGASDFAHLVGEEFAESHRAALPLDANVVDRVGARTLEYTPHRLNVVLDPAGRIVAIGCF